MKSSMKMNRKHLAEESKDHEAVHRVEGQTDWR